MQKGDTMAEKDNKKIIKINERFSLAYDDNGDKWIIETKISDKGKKTERVYCGYHWHFNTLLQSFVKKRMPEQEAATVKGALKALAAAEKEMTDISEKIGKELDAKWQR
jgi:hypothetical protein